MPAGRKKRTTLQKEAFEEKVLGKAAVVEVLPGSCSNNDKQLFKSKRARTLWEGEQMEGSGSRKRVSSIGH